jgi:DNA repair exonuclease SbcCD nuclease subunit
MERTKTNSPPDLILCSDMHLREDKPVCRTDNFIDEQTQDLGFLCGLQSKYDCPVVHAGDLFHHWKPSPWLLSYAIGFLPNQFYTIYGQHDLPQHNWELRDKSGIYTLERAGKIQIYDGCHYGQEPLVKSTMPFLKDRFILVWHHMTYITPPFPGATGGQAEGILRKYSAYDLIVTGDNHQAFATEYEGRLLVNPGSFTRQNASQIDFKPRVYLWYAKTNIVEAVYLPIKEDAISREHIEVTEQRGARIDAFISKLSDEWEAGMSFEGNLEAFFQTNRVRQGVKDIIYKAIE